jgi:uncharacterized protein (TIGR04255 family)
MADDATRYSRAPITEAIIDLRVALPPGHRSELFSDAFLSSATDYPKRRQLSQAISNVEIGTSISTSTVTEPVGWICSSDDDKQIVQFRRDGFTFSRLAPYGAWEPFRDEARKLWLAYRAHAAPAGILRLAVRYINQINIPFDAKPLKLEDYFRFYPELPDDEFPPIAHFFVQVQLPQEDIEAVAVVREVRLPPPSESQVSVLLDIDLFREEKVPTKDADIWEIFEQLRERKNQIFNRCITGRTKELIQ